MAETIYTIPLRKAFGKQKRAKNAVRIVRNFLGRNTKSDNIKLDPSISEKLWRQGIRNIPRRIRVRVKKEEDRIIATLSE